jgi:hypothetical protein
MKTCWLFLAFVLLHVASWAQPTDQPTNLGFEQFDAQRGRPLGWYTGGAGYQVAVDSLVHYEGRYSLRLAAMGATHSPNAFGVATQQLPVTFRGRCLSSRAT